MGIEKKGQRSNGTEQKVSESGQERTERYRSWGEFGKVDGRYYEAGVKNERHKKISSLVPLSAPTIEVDGSATW